MKKEVKKIENVNRRKVMKSNTIRNLVMGTLTAVAAMIGIGTATNAQAQRLIIRGPRVIIAPTHRPHWDRFYWERRREFVDHVSEQREEGYEDGFKAGRDDAREGRDFEPVDQKKYIKAPGYAYRRAFVCGYEDGYRKNIE